MHPDLGGIVAGALFVLPSLLIPIATVLVLSSSAIRRRYRLFYGIKPAVTAIVVQAAHRIGLRAPKNGCPVGDFAAAAFVAIFALDSISRPSSLRQRRSAMPAGGRCPDRFVAGGGHGRSPRAHTHRP